MRMPWPPVIPEPTRGGAGIDRGAGRESGRSLERPLNNAWNADRAEGIGFNADAGLP